MVDKETVDLIQQIYQKHPTGGALHNVLDDGNINDRDIQWCLDNTIAKGEEDFLLYYNCAVNLLRMGKSDRYHTIEAAWKGGLG